MALQKRPLWSRGSRDFRSAWPPLAGILDLTEGSSGEDGQIATIHAVLSAIGEGPLLIWLHDARGGVTVNSRYLTLTGQAQSELCSNGWRSILHPEDVDEYLGAYAEAYAGRKAFEKDVRIAIACGGYAQFRSSCWPCYRSNDAFWGYVGYSWPVTDSDELRIDLLRARELLREERRTKQDLIAALARDLQNPVEALRGAARVVCAASASQAELAWAAELIEQHLNRLSALASDLSETSRGVDDCLPISLEEDLQVQSAPTCSVILVGNGEDTTADLAVMLQIQGHHVRTARDHESTLRLALETPPSVVMIDLDVAGPLGFKLATTIRRQEWGRTTVLIALARWSGTSVIRQAMRSGFDECLTKPLKLQRLFGILSRRGE